MYIKRVQVEEGFLDGLDVFFAQGLNVIIGERGTGKTSLIELIRFCLNAQGHTPQSARRSTEHALSVLGSGQVTVTLANGDHETLITRTASLESPRASGFYQPPLIFSQTEIESVALQAPGRLHLLDAFSPAQGATELAESQAISEIRSFTAQTEALRRETSAIAAKVDEISALDEQLTHLTPKEEELTNVLAAAHEKRNSLDTLSDLIAGAASRIAVIERFLASISQWRTSLAMQVSAAPLLEPWPDGVGPDALLHSRERVQVALGHVNNALAELDAAHANADTQRRLSIDNKLELEEHARQLRREVDSLQEGAGATLRRGQQLRERKAELEPLRTVLSQRRDAISSLLAQRTDALDRLDSIRDRRFGTRNNTAVQLSQTLGPRIQATVRRAGQFEAYAAAIAESMRGSGLRYNELSSTVAATVSPRELLEAVDRNDFDLIADATGITRDRAARVLSHLRESDLGALATVAVEDTVAFQLLDGTTYKSIDELSTGQRCTVVLPLVLRHTDRVLIVDQPEDHIDNAFITETLIVSVLNRPPQGQIVFSTHNANIPVLGEADRVIQLGSDGKRGFPIIQSNLRDSRVVRAITSVMEGGVEAFQQRVSFYSHNHV